VTQRIALSCGPQEVTQGLCNETHIGEFLLTTDAEKNSKNVIKTEAVHINKTATLTGQYPIKNTGYYCVLTKSYTADEYTAIVEFRNAYGELPATQIPKLPFYGGITILYAVITVSVFQLHFCDVASTDGV
jgi:Lung seven transmembrane receptor